MRLDRKLYVDQLERKLARLVIEIGRIQTKAGRTGVDTMVRFDRVAESLQRIHREVALHLRDIRAASDATWESLKTDAGHPQLRVRDARESNTRAI